MRYKLALTVIAGSLALTACANELVTAPIIPDQTVLSGILSRPFLPGQQQPVADTNRGFTYAIYPLGVGQNLVQTFTPAANEWLGYIQLPVGCATGVDLLIRVRQGIGGPIIGAKVTNGWLPNVVDGTFQQIQIYDAAIDPRGIRIRRGTTYSIELSAVPRSGTETSCGIAPGPAGSSYAGGQGWYEDIPINGPGFLPLPGGEDLPFITQVR